MSAYQRFKKIFDPIDLTQGNIAKVLVAFMIPIMLSMFFQQIYTLTDTIIVGQNLSSPEIAGINDSATLTYLVLDFVVGCASGFSVVIADKIGEKNMDGARKSFLVQIVLGVILSVIVTVAAILLINPFLSLLHIYPNSGDATMEKVYASARIYLIVLYSGTVATMFYNLIVSVLRAMGDAFTPFLFLVFGTLLNIGLDLLFIVVIPWGVMGAAVATVISQSVSAIGCFLYAFLRFKDLRIHKADWKFGWKDIYQHLRLGLPLGFQYSILSIGIIIMQAAIISFDYDQNGAVVPGVPCQVGYGVANKVVGLLMTPLAAIGTGVIAYMGQNKGAKDWNRIRKGFEVSVLISLATWLIVMTIGLLFTINGAYQHIFLSGDKISDETLHYGNEYLYIALPNFGFLGVLFVGRNALQGIEKPLFPFLAGVAELLARSLICLYLPAAVNGGPVSSLSGSGPYAAVCVADPAAWFIAFCFLAIPFVIDAYVKAPDRKKAKPER
jgi:Na+-driven multidrug efflux pump